MTMSAEKGGGNMSGNTRSGFVKFIHQKGYGFVECDDDVVEDSYIPPNIVAKHVLTDSDEIRYTVGKNSGREAVAKIISINGEVLHEKVPTKIARKVDKDIENRFSEMNKLDK